MVIVQLRGTIFVPLNVSYTPENAAKFRELLLPDARAYNAIAPERIVPGVNPNTPQYGMPWRLFKKVDNEGDYNIVFLPDKIDIILNKDVRYGDDTESNFCKKCIDWFTKILLALGNPSVSRIAYAPLYAIRLDKLSSDYVWSKWLKGSTVNGSTMQDINLNYLLKREVCFSDRKIQMNLVHNITDGIQVLQGEEGNPVHKVVLVQFDLNSIPESPLTLDCSGIKVFFEGILGVKNNLVDNVTE